MAFDDAVELALAPGVRAKVDAERPARPNRNCASATFIA
jgi:hypothetical protein